MSKPKTAQSVWFESEARHAGAGLLLFDLDDTIVQAGSMVSARVLHTLAAARDAGYVLSVASGRPLCFIHEDILASGVMHYAVCSNGSTVTRLADGSLICKRSMSREDALDCYSMLAPYKPAWNAFFGDCAYFEWKGASYMLTGRTGAVARASRYRDSGGGKARGVAFMAKRGLWFAKMMLTTKGHRQVRSVLPHLRRATEGVDKIGCTIPNAVKCAQAAELLEEDSRFEVVRMGTTELEITRCGVTKGTGTRELLTHLGMDSRDAVAFGDGGNDLPLAQAVGCFVAMGNADDEVKRQADDVCPSVAEDGVATWIEQHLLS